VDGGSGNLQIYGCNTGIDNRDTDPLVYNARSFEIVKYCLDGHSMFNRGFGTNYIARIKNSASGKYLTAVGDTIVFKSETNKNDQQWFITQNADGSHFIRSLVNGKAIDVKARGFNAGSELQLYEYNGSMAQTFYFHEVSQKVSIIKPVYTNCVFDMDAGSFIPHLYPFGTGDVQVSAQRMEIVDISSVASMKVDSLPQKTVYNLGEKLDLSGLKISAVTENGTIFEAFEYTVSPNENLDTAGVNRVNVSFAGASVDFEVNVIDPNALPPEPSEIILKPDAESFLENNYLIVSAAEKTVEKLLEDFENKGLLVADCFGNELSSDSFVGTGSQISLVKDGTVSDYLHVVVMGDVDGNGCIDTTDYLRIKNYFLGEFELDELFGIAGDMDSNGEIEATDYLRIKSLFLQK
jgi:hypothetical protein